MSGLGTVGGHLGLGFDVGVITLLPRPARLAAGVLITEWVRQNLDQVPWPTMPGEPIYIRGSDRTVPINWCLWQALLAEVGLGGPLAGVVHVSFARPDDLERRREERLAQTLKKKLPKLRTAADGRRRSILVRSATDS